MLLTAHCSAWLQHYVANYTYLNSIWACSKCEATLHVGLRGNLIKTALLSRWTGSVVLMFTESHIYKRQSLLIALFELKHSADRGCQLWLSACTQFVILFKKKKKNQSVGGFVYTRVARWVWGFRRGNYQDRRAERNILQRNIFNFHVFLQYLLCSLVNSRMGLLIQASEN